jgi:DNA-binding transcriptional regulator YiaG
VLTSEEFKAALTRLNVSQARFAAAVDTDHTTVNKWANGRMPPRWAQVLVDLMERFDLDVEDLEITP